MTIPKNGRARWAAAAIAVAALLTTGVSAHWIAVNKINKNEQDCIIARQERTQLAKRQRFVEFVLIRVADKLDVDVSGFE